MARTLKNRLVYRIHDRALDASLARYASGRMIDIGCGQRPYLPMAERYVQEYVGLDRPQPFSASARPDLVGSAYEIPAEDSSFDSAMSTATLEHLEEPEQALRETFRVLKPGGVAIYTVPLIWQIHAEPWDFFRFTKYGLRYLFEKVGFDVVALDPLSGFWVTFGQSFSYYLYRFHRGPLRFLPIIPLLSIGVQAMAYGLDKLDRAEDWTWMYLVVARKPENG